jgi:hypothetical protein
VSRRSLALSIAIAVFVPRVASAVELELFTRHQGMYRSLSEEMLFAQLRFPTTSTFTQTLAEYQGSLYGALRWRPFDALGIELGIDSGLIEIRKNEVTGNGKPIGKHAKETLFLGETFAELQIGETGVLAIRAGKIVTRVAEGAVFDAYSLGVSADADLSLVDPENRWRFRAEVVLPDATFTSSGKSSPLFHLEIGNRALEETELFVFGSAFADAKNALSPILADAVFRGRLGELIATVRRGSFDRLRLSRAARAIREGFADGTFGFDVGTEGFLSWSGVGLRHRGSSWRLTGTFVLCLGEIRADVRPFETLGILPELNDKQAVETFLRPSKDEVSIRSGLIDLSASFRLGEAVELGGFVLGVTGDAGFGRTDGDAVYRSFVSLSPRLTYTSIFFNGGVSTTLASPTIASIAPDGAGLFAIGVNAMIRPIDRLELRPTFAAMFATRGANLTGGKFYGYEANLLLDLAVIEHVTLHGDAALFVPGSYYGAGVPVGGQVILGLAIDFGA